jgi:hypothetical protein
LRSLIVFDTGSGDDESAQVLALRLANTAA